MKKIIIITCIIVMALSLKSQEIRTFSHKANGNVVEIPISDIDSITFFSIPNNSTGVLINGVVWATCNVNAPGTFASSPTESGMFYQWNRKVGWSSTDPLVNHLDGITWDSSVPTGDSWEKANDPCPVGWRVPTYEEEQSLVNSGSFWGELNGVKGRFFGTGSQRVFFPAAGDRSYDGGTLSYVGGGSDYWSSTPYSIWHAYHLGFYSGDAHTDYSNRTYGFLVRCVSEKFD